MIVTNTSDSFEYFFSYDLTCVMLINVLQKFTDHECIYSVNVYVCVFYRKYFSIVYINVNEHVYLSFFW